MHQDEAAEAGGFTFIDLFAGIGGFHAALSAYGGSCWMACEIDQLASKVYERNWGLEPKGDINLLTPADGDIDVPPHDVLAAGFPCQPFSKSGKQHGFRDATRGTLFFSICRILEVHRPPVIVLENVRNLAGPRQRDTWITVVQSLRGLGYNVSWTPAVASPHLLPPELGGTPQVRERVFITGTYTGRPVELEADFEPVVTNRPVPRLDGQAWNPQEHWNLDADLPLEDDDEVDPKYRLTGAEHRWIDCWDDFLSILDEETLPGFPIWADHFRVPALVPPGTPPWKANFLRKNADLYERNRPAIDDWRARWNHLAWMPPSRRKLEWQAQDTEPRSLRECVLHFRPSGIRAKRGTYLPALVAITQTSVLGKRGRKVTPLEAARLQGLPDWFDFGPQGDAATYKQLGNGVAVGAAYYVLREHVKRDETLLRQRGFGHIVDTVMGAPPAPVVSRHGQPVSVDTCVAVIDRDSVVARA